MPYELRPSPKVEDAKKRIDAAIADASDHDDALALAGWLYVRALQMFADPPLEICRTRNPPTGELGEYLAALLLGLEKDGNASRKGFDALDRSTDPPSRVQIKTMWGGSISSPVRIDLGEAHRRDARDVDEFVVVKLDEHLGGPEIWRLPVERLQDVSSWNKRTQSYRIQLAKLRGHPEFAVLDL